MTPLSLRATRLMTTFAQLSKTDANEVVKLLAARGCAEAAEAALAFCGHAQAFGDCVDDGRGITGMNAGHDRVPNRPGVDVGGCTCGIRFRDTNEAREHFVGKTEDDYQHAVDCVCNVCHDHAPDCGCEPCRKERRATRGL